LSFYDYQKYDALKDYWASKASPWRLSSNAVESWKATFEEFGLLYVESGSNRISITPAGAQLRDAADRSDQTEFAWIGLNLLLRYPLRGPRRPKSETHRDADLLLYRFWFTALLDLEGYIWWTELERILCRVFQTSEGQDAIRDIIALRANPTLLAKVNLPVAQRAGAFYNSLNQVVVHAGMNHLLLSGDDSECPYGVGEPKRRVFVKRDWLGMIRKALSVSSVSDHCHSGPLTVAQVPSAPYFQDEVSYFAYLGGTVTSFAAATPTPIATVDFQGERVFVLTTGKHYEVDSELAIRGAIATLCQLAKGQRLALSHDERWTYIIEQKELISAKLVRIRIRRARPISNPAILKTMWAKADG